MNLANLSSGTLFEALFCGFICSILAALLWTTFARRTHLLDVPNAEPHKQHKFPVPISGGLTFFSVLLLCSFLFRKYLNAELFGLLGAAIIIFAFALWDDYSPLNWKIKLFGQFLAATALILSGTQTHLFEAKFASELPVTLRGVADIGLTFFWVVFITNAYNLVDSADGLMLGLCSWTLGFFIIAALDAGQFSLALLCTLMLGPALALKFFNTFPAKLFMGDSGAQTIGFLLSAIAIQYNPPELLQAKTWYLTILMLGVPIFDSVMVVISRNRKGLHFYSSGTDHTFHRLLRMGFSRQQASSFMHMVCFLLEVIGFFAISRSVLQANLIFLLIVLCGFAAIYFLENENLWKAIQQFNDPTEKLS